MKLFVRICISFILVVIFYIVDSGFFNYDRSNLLRPLTHSNFFQNDSIEKLKTKVKINSNLPSLRKRDVAVCVVVCEDRIRKAIVSIKSAIIFARNCSLKVVIFAEPKLIPGINKTLSRWTDQNNFFYFETHPIYYPQKQAEEWKNLFQPCAMQVFFLPSILKHLDSVLFVHSDVLFLSPLDEIWKHFDKMNSTQLAALSPALKYGNIRRYNLSDLYRGELRLDSGVMLMNLTRMRNFGWEKHLISIFQEYKQNITLGDQDMINILFNSHPERLYIFDCSYNYRPDHCMNVNICHPAETNGVCLLHGLRGMFHNTYVPTIKAVFISYEMYHLGTDLYHHLILPMEYRLKETAYTICGKFYNIFIKRLFDYINRDDYDYNQII